MMIIQYSLQSLSKGPNSDDHLFDARSTPCVSLFNIVGIER